MPEKLELLTLIKAFSESERAKLEPLILYITDSLKKWNAKLVKCEKGENIIYDSLMSEGYEIAPFRYQEEGEISEERKREKAQEPRFPDFFAFHVGEKEPSFEPWFFGDVKLKTKHEHLGIVNVNDYEGYWKWLRSGKILAPFKIFFYINETKGIYVHDLRDPKAEPSLETTITTMIGKPVYQIFLSEIKFWKKTG